MFHYSKPVAQTLMHSTYGALICFGLAAGVSDSSAQTTMSMDMASTGSAMMQPDAASTATETSMPEPPDAGPQMQKVLDAIKASGAKPITTLTPEQARMQPTPADAVAQVLKDDGKSTAPEEVGKVSNRTIPSAAGEIPVRVYMPKDGGDDPLPVIVYYHGGGWVIATIDTYDASARALANAADAIVVSVEYRKAPEHKYPAAADDALAAYKWVLENAKEIGGNPDKVAVAGESAGGNLAAVTSMRAAEDDIKVPVHQLLVYPVSNHAFDTESYQENANAKPLNKAMMQWFYNHYLNSPAEGKEPHASILMAEEGALAKMPPTTIVLAEIDPLRSEGEELGEKLEAAGVDVKSELYTGVVHEFFGMGAVVDKAKEAVKFAADDLKESFEE